MASPAHEGRSDGLQDPCLERIEGGQKEIHSNLPLATEKSDKTSIVETAAPGYPQLNLVQSMALVAVICLSQLLTLAGVAQGIGPLQLRAIAESFNTTDFGKISWFPSAFAFTAGCLVLPAGRWGDLYRHKRLFLCGYACFSLCSLAAGFSVWSHSAILFAVLRALQGIGPALLLPNGLAILARCYPPGLQRDVILSIFGAAAPAGLVLGAVFTGLFTELIWWPWAYWVLGIVLAVLFGLAAIVVPDDTESRSKVSLRELDVPGTVLGLAGLLLFSFAWTQAPSAGWDQVYVYVPLIFGLVLLAMLTYNEIKVAAYPLLPREAFTLETGLVFGCISTGWASFGVWILYLLQILQLVRGDSILQAAAELAPAAVSGAIAALVTGYLMSKLQPGWIMIVSMLCFGSGLTLVATNPAGRTYWAQLFLSSIITAWGMEMSFPAAVILLSNRMPPTQQGIAASLVNTAVNYSIAIGIGMAGTVDRYSREDGANALQAYRDALYFAIGLDGLGLLMAVLLAYYKWREWRNRSEALPSV